jgi:hypothetical protein
MSESAEGFLKFYNQGVIDGMGEKIDDAVLAAIGQEVSYENLRRGSMSDSEWKQLNLHYAENFREKKEYRLAYNAYRVADTDKAQEYLAELLRVPLPDAKSVKAHVDMPSAAIEKWAETHKNSAIMTELINSSGDTYFSLNLPSGTYYHLGDDLKENKNVTIGGSAILMNLGWRQRGKINVVSGRVLGEIRENLGEITIKPDIEKCDIDGNAGTLNARQIYSSNIWNNAGKICGLNQKDLLLIDDSDIACNRGRIYASIYGSTVRENAGLIEGSIEKSKIINNGGGIRVSGFEKNKNRHDEFSTIGTIRVDGELIDCPHIHQYNQGRWDDMKDFLKSCFYGGSGLLLGIGGFLLGTNYAVSSQDFPLVFPGLMSGYAGVVFGAGTIGFGVKGFLHNIKNRKVKCDCDKPAKKENFKIVENVHYAQRWWEDYFELRASDGSIKRVALRPTKKGRFKYHCPRALTFNLEDEYDSDKIKPEQIRPEAVESILNHYVSEGHHKFRPFGKTWSRYNLCDISRKSDDFMFDAPTRPASEKTYEFNVFKPSGRGWFKRDRYHLLKEPLKGDTHAMHLALSFGKIDKRVVLNPDADGYFRHRCPNTWKFDLVDIDIGKDVNFGLDNIKPAVLQEMLKIRDKTSNMCLHTPDKGYLEPKSRIMDGRGWWRA